ncbi:Os04g0379916 [Oryza sativa Japonica Group]|uniref:Os04g0379916 protein n=1 Tax=Oryza sativa subsp. japonica TaxID=39947 RepID=A0A0P0W9C1_ORYSJ|nr:Os04g0379916 [Oryza sativa Japonica Group]
MMCKGNPSRDYSHSYHPRPNQVLYCLLNLFHVNTSSKVHVLIKKITMPVLFSSPCSCPNSPGGWACASFISDTIKGVKHCLIGRKSFLSNHVSN